MHLSLNRRTGARLCNHQVGSLSSLLQKQRYTASLYIAWRGQAAAEADVITLACEERIEPLGTWVALRQAFGSRLVTVPLICDVTNKGLRSVSIVSYDVMLVTPDGGERGSYTGLRGPLGDQALSPVTLPFMLQSGETRRIAVNIGVIADSLAASELQQSFPIDTMYSGRAITFRLAEKGISLSGYPVSIRTYGSDSSDYVLEWNTNVQRANPVLFAVRMRTALGSVAEVIREGSSAWLPR